LHFIVIFYNTEIFIFQHLMFWQIYTGNLLSAGDRFAAVSTIWTATTAAGWPGQ
jgi:hypothetical protein